MENNLEEKLSAILSNPDMMKTIQAMAQSLGQSAPQQPPQQQPQQTKNEETKSNIPDMDFSMLQKLSGLTGQTGIDQNQQTLLAALSPYLSQNRVRKLENAMRAAKMARIASAFIGNGGLQMFTGR